MNHRIDPTPNPNSLKITFPSPVTARPATYTTADAADPLARRLLSVPGVKSVFLLNNFCTVTKDASADWGTLTADLEKALDELERNR